MYQAQRLRRGSFKSRTSPKIKETSDILQPGFLKKWIVNIMVQYTHENLFSSEYLKADAVYSVPGREKCRT